MGSSGTLPQLFVDKKLLAVIRPLGEGAFARVFEAEWENEPLAVKVLKADQTAALEFFKQEYLLGKNLCHPAFVRFFRFGWTSEETPFYTMELLKGYEIKTLWPKLNFLSKKLLCYQLFLGLTLLHKKGLVHRDLKPSNLLVVRTPRVKLPFQLKIMDLGLAQSSIPSEDEEVGGTVDYLAPELIRKEKADDRADFYACGIILSELFLGRPPYADPDPAATLARHQEAPLPELTIRNRKEKSFWQNLIGRLAAKSKEERPKDGTELLGLLLEDPALRKALAGQDESAAGWCRTLLPRPWASPNPGEVNECSAETPATVSRANEELTDRRDLEKGAVLPSVRLAIKAENFPKTYPRLTEGELEHWLAASFGAAPEAAMVLWKKTSGEVSLIEFELNFLQQKKLLEWSGVGWVLGNQRLKDTPLSPASKVELLALTATLPAEEQKFLIRLSSFLDFFRPEEVAKAGLWEKSNLDRLLKNLEKSGFILSLDEHRYIFSRPGLREALHSTLKQRQDIHRKIWGYFVQGNQTADPSRSPEREFQAAGAGLWEEAARQALIAAGQAGAREDFKTEHWYLDRSQKWAKKIPVRSLRNSVLLDIYFARGDLFGRQGELKGAAFEYRRMTRLAHRLKNPEREATACNRLGNYLRQIPDYPKAEAALKRALALFQKIGDETKLSYAHNNLGASYAHQLRIEEALAHYTQAAEIQRRLGAAKNLASTLNNIGVAHMMADRLHEAVRFLREALQLNRELDEKEQTALCLNNLGFILAQRGELDGAKTLLLEALELNRQIGSQKWEVLNIDNLAIVAYRSGNYPEAIRHALLGIELSEKINFKGNHLSLLATLGGSLKARGQYAEAEKYLTHGLSLVEEIHDLPSEIPLRLEKIELALLVNDWPEAEKAAGEASKRITGVKDRSLRARLSMLLAKLAAGKGETAEAKRYMDDAEKLLSESEYFPERQRLMLEQVELSNMENKAERIGELLSGVRTLSAVPVSPALSCEGFLLEARSAFDAGQFEIARQKAAEALRLAYDLAEPEKIWRLHHFTAKLWMQGKNYQKAFLELQKAAQVLEGLKGNFTSEESLNTYFDDPQKVELLSEIQKVAEVLAQ